MDHELDREVKFESVPPLEFIYERISVVANIENEVPDGSGGYRKEKAQRVILKECSGKFEPGSMTAILGPSGSGKTTMLNLLSGRLLSTNLELRGSIKINNRPVTNMGDYKSSIGYVMQEDFMLATFTPRESFRFICDMRLSHKTSQEKHQIVESMLQSLGLTKCAETYIGNSLIRGLSGGERKRTSVGVELLINPSLVFLDEPTTGLDSTTALNLMKFLNRLAAAGRTIVTTIHQPSSQIFRQFDKILLMLDGNIVYNSSAQQSVAYFARLGMPVPVHSNPMDHYMKVMNKEGISLRYIHEGKQIDEEQVKIEFDQRVQMLVRSYKFQEGVPASTCDSQLKGYGHEAGWLTQMSLIFKRSVINELRNPLGIRSKIFQTIFFSVVIIILFEREAESMDSYLQNSMGLIFFIVTSNVFSGVFGSVNIFGQERGVFIRERLSNTYHTSSYYVGRSLAYIPLETFLPLLMLAICYFAVPLDHSGTAFIITLGALWLVNWMSSAYGLFLSTAFSNPEVPLALIPVLIIPLMLVGGLFAPLDRVPEFYRVFQYISMFKYGFQAVCYAQFNDDRQGFSLTLRGRVFNYKGDILGPGNQLYFEQPFWLSMFLMGIIGLAIRALSLLGLYLISNPKKLKLLPPLSLPTENRAHHDMPTAESMVRIAQ